MGIPENLCYECVITGQETSILSGFLTKKIRRSDTPYPPFSGVEEWSLPQIFEIFKRKNFFSEGELKNFFREKMLIE